MSTEPRELVDSTSLGDIRLDVEPQPDKPLLVEIARTDVVSSYLSGVSHTLVTDVYYNPFEASYSRQAGESSPAAPGDQRIWAASTHGAGPQTLTWDAEDADWSIVVMNADGPPGVQADISTGAKLPYLTEIGWSARPRGNPAAHRGRSNRPVTRTPAHRVAPISGRTRRRDALSIANEPGNWP